MARLRRLQIHYERVMSAALPGALGTSWWFPGIVTQREWNPPTDLVETASECVVTLEIAGLREDEFEVVLYPEHLVVQGERPWRRLGEAARLHRAEIRYGPFHAAVQIPCGPGSLDVDRIKVEYQDGLLRIRLPKTEGRR
ncbi:MAG TPA: Hsp20/alpha crystallin family protein [Myxococcaceae bacterium]|nr:Hsp20/alpha crystallin family protein [Myxococcaceae bacterium]